MYYNLVNIVTAIAGPLTQRTLENLRRTMEDLYVKSTAQDASPEDQAAFTPSLIAQAHEVARQDNAKTIVSWAQAIYSEMRNAELQNEQLQKVTGYLATAKDKLTFYEQDASIPAEAIQAAKKDISRLTQILRNLQEPPQTVPGHSSSSGPGEVSSGGEHLDGDLPIVP